MLCSCSELSMLEVIVLSCLGTGKFSIWSGDKSVERRDAVDEALRYLSSSMFSTLHSLKKNNQLYTLKDKELGDWSEVIKCQFEKRRLSVLFQEVPLRVMEALGARRPGGLMFRVVEVDENAEVVTREV